MLIITTTALVLLQLKEGTLVQVPPSLVKRCKTHFLNLPCGATVILGNNGYVWISPLDNEEATLTDGQTERFPEDDTVPKQVNGNDQGFEYVNKIIHRFPLALCL